MRNYAIIIATAVVCFAIVRAIQRRVQQQAHATSHEQQRHVAIPDEPLPHYTTADDIHIHSIVRQPDEKTRFDQALRSFVLQQLATSTYDYKHSVFGKCGFVSTGFLMHFMRHHPEWADFVEQYDVKLCRTIVFPPPPRDITLMTELPVADIPVFELDTSEPTNWKWRPTLTRVPAVAVGANHLMVIDRDLRLYDPTIEQFDPEQVWNLCVVHVGGL